MTKVGEGKTPNHEPTEELYHQQIDQSTLKFINALETYQQSSGDDRSRLKDVMDQQLGIIRSAINGLKQAGIYKQDVKVEKDYQAYMNQATTENYAALQHDLSTLRDYNKL